MPFLKTMRETIGAAGTWVSESSSAAKEKLNRLTGRPIERNWGEEIDSHISLDDFFVYCSDLSGFEGKCYKALYDQVIGFLEGMPLVQVQEHLGLLYQALRQKLALKFEQAILSHFDYDFKVFSYFICARLGYSSKEGVEPVVYEAALGMSEAAWKERYGNMLASLLQIEMDAAISIFHKTTPDMVGLKRQLKIFEQLSRGLVLEHESEFSPVQHRSFKEVFSTWLLVLIEWFKTLINVKISPKERLYLDVPDQLIQLMYTQGLSVLTGNAERGQVLSDWYAHGARYYEAQLKLPQNVSEMTDVETFKRVFDLELERIQKWGQYYLRAALVKDGSGLGHQLTHYLLAYQTVQTRLQCWSEKAYEVRMELERRFFREAPSGYGLLPDNYLKKLNKVDQLCLTLYERMGDVQNGWLMDVESVFLNASVKAANVCFAVLQHIDVQKLGWAEWIHLTCVDMEQTEKRFKDEMDKRNESFHPRCFRAYHVGYTHTMTDEVAEALPALIKEVKSRLMVKIHPDKHMHHPGVAAVATYCSQVLTHRLEKAKNMSEIWTQERQDGGTLTAIHRVNFSSLPLAIEGKGQPRADRIHQEADYLGVFRKSKEPFDLQTLMMHRDYVRQMELGKNLRRASEDPYYWWDYDSLKDNWAYRREVAERAALLSELEKARITAEFQAKQERSGREADHKKHDIWMLRRTFIKEPFSGDAVIFSAQMEELLNELVFDETAEEKPRKKEQERALLRSIILENPEFVALRRFFDNVQTSVSTHSMFNGTVPKSENRGPEDQFKA